MRTWRLPGRRVDTCKAANDIYKVNSVFYFELHISKAFPYQIDIPSRSKSPVPAHVSETSALPPQLIPRYFSNPPMHYHKMHFQLLATLLSLAALVTAAPEPKDCIRRPEDCKPETSRSSFAIHAATSTRSSTFTASRAISSSMGTTWTENFCYAFNSATTFVSTDVPVTSCVTYSTATLSPSIAYGTSCEVRTYSRY
jgi:hypothetical protein